MHIQIPNRGSGRPYKVYTALLTQTGTNAPVATVLENTLGGTVVWSYDSSGTYTATLTGAFTSNKTLLLATQTALGMCSSINYIVNDANSITIYTSDTSCSQTDALLNSSPIEIRVYN